MKELYKGVYNTVNPQDEACSICREVTRIVNHRLGEAIYTLPEEYGTGYLKKSFVGQSSAVVVYDFLFQSGITMKATSEDDSLKLNFHLGDSFQWGLGGRQDNFIMERDESCIFPAGAIHCSGRYEPGLRYRGVSIKLHTDRYASVLECFQAAGVIQDMKDGQSVCKKHRMTASVMELVRQVVICPFSGVAGSLYVEGKILELIAVYLNEMVREKGKGAATIKLSREDIKGLQRVKGMLDECFAEPMTISELSKLVYINEYKLKAGFKEVYGKPIYSYVIDRRMERAKQLLAEKQMKVKEAASMVGYTNISHFIETFRKRFGVSPGKLS
jgi:AraC-like DNA-binding protein